MMRSSLGLLVVFVLAFDAAARDDGELSDEFPKNRSNDVPRDTVIRVTWTGTRKPKRISITAGGFRNPMKIVGVQGKKTWDPRKRLLTLKPDKPLPPGFRVHVDVVVWPAEKFDLEIVIPIRKSWDFVTAGKAPEPPGKPPPPWSWRRSIHRVQGDVSLLAALADSSGPASVFVGTRTKEDGATTVVEVRSPAGEKWSPARPAFPKPLPAEEHPLVATTSSSGFLLLTSPRSARRFEFFGGWTVLPGPGVEWPKRTVTMDAKGRPTVFLPDGMITLRDGAWTTRKLGGDTVARLAGSTGFKGDTTVVWLDATGGLWGAASTPAGSWSADTKLNKQHANPAELQVATASDGSAVAMWVRDGPVICAAHFIDGRWTAPVAMETDNVREVFGIRVLMDGKGRALGLLHTVVEGRAAAALWAIEFDGTEWSMNRVSREVGAVALRSVCRVAMSASGHACVVWTEGNKWARHFARRFSFDGGWLEEWRMSTSVKRDSTRGPSVAVDETGRAIVTWIEFGKDRSGDVMVRVSSR